MHETRDLDHLLAEVSLLSGLSARHRKRLVSKGKTVDHRPGAAVTAQGLGGLALHVVLEGTADVEVHGREVRTLAVGDYFGEVSMVDGKPRSATVTAGADGLRTLAIPHLAFMDLVEHDAEAAKVLLVALCARLRTAEEAIGH